MPDVHDFCDDPPVFLNPAVAVMNCREKRASMLRVAPRTKSFSRPPMSGRKRRLFLPAAAALLLALLFTAGCPGPDGGDRSLEMVKLKGYFVVGLDDKFPPLGFRRPLPDRTVRYELNPATKKVERFTAGDELAGFDIDLAKNAAARLGVKVVFRPVAWDGVIDRLAAGEIDMIWNGLSITPERRERIIFSRPYLDNRQTVMVRSGAAISRRADLRGKRVGVQLGSSSEKALQADRRLAMQIAACKRYPDDMAAIGELAAGRIDAVIIDEVMGRYLAARQPGVFTVLAEDFGREQYAVGFRKKDRALRDAVDRVLTEMKADGSADAISRKWFGAVIVTKQEPTPD